jgi:hypothetical protein
MHRLASAAALAALVAVASPGAAQGPLCLAPGGVDDTAALQAALDRCSSAARPCEVRLCAGVFHTGILRVRDFRGTLRGAGPRATVLRALPDLPVSERDGFFREDPFDPDGKPWPYLLQLVEGRASIRDLGILVPAPPAGTRPTTGWTLLEGFDPAFELRGAILLTGRQAVDFEVSRVRIEAERDPESVLETTTFHGVEFSGLLFDPNGLEPYPVFPARGRFRLADSEILGVLGGAPVWELSQARVEVEGSRIRAAVAVDVIDVDLSQVLVRGNRWTTSARGVQVLQNLDGVPSRASGILVDDNEGALLPFAPGFGDGVFFQDPIDASPEPGDTVVWATRNRLALGSEADAVGSGITLVGAARPKLGMNRLSGRVARGLDLDDTTRCLVLGNSVRGLDTAGGPDLRLGGGTSDCLAIVGKDDAVVDEGQANRVVRRRVSR